MLEIHILVWEVAAIDTHASSSIAPGDIASLHHEVLDHSVEDVSFVSQFLRVVASAEGAEVFSCLGAVVFEQLNANLSFAKERLTSNSMRPRGFES